MKLDGLSAVLSTKPALSIVVLNLAVHCSSKRRASSRYFREALLPGTVGRNNLVGWQNRDIEVDLLKVSAAIRLTALARAA